MLENLLWVSVGLIVGWNAIPQPLWVERLYEKTRQKVKDAFRKMIDKRKNG